jgi:hypothetical protein
VRIVGIHLEPTGVGWHRCWNWTTAMERMGHEVRHRPFDPCQFTWSGIDKYLRGADVVITSKTSHADIFAGLLAGRDLYKYKLVVDTDDNVDAITPDNVAFKHFHSGVGMARLIKAQYHQADLVTVTTPDLRREVEAHSGHVVIMPNVVDPRLHEKVKPWQKEARHRDDIRIYWGGGAGHWNDLLMVKDNLLRLFHEDKRVKLVFSNFVPAWAAMLDAFRVFMIPFADFYAYPQVLKWVCADIAIAPLCDNTHNRAKSNVKYLDYAMADVPGVYSDLPPYESVRDGVTGLKASATGWYDAIKRLIEDVELRRSIAVAARQHVLDEFTIERWAPRYESMLKELLRRRPIEVKPLTEGVPIEAVNYV